MTCDCGGSVTCDCGGSVRLASLGVLSRSSATPLFLAGSIELNCSHKSPSNTHWEGGEGGSGRMKRGHMKEYFKIVYTTDKTSFHTHTHLPPHVHTHLPPHVHIFHRMYTSSTACTHLPPHVQTHDVVATLADRIQSTFLNTLHSCVHVHTLHITYRIYTQTMTVSRLN